MEVNFEEREWENVLPCYINMIVLLAKNSNTIKIKNFLRSNNDKK